MTSSRIETLKSLLKPAVVRYGAPLAAAGTFWDFMSSQFGWLTLGSLLGRGRDFIPTWAWIDLLLCLGLYALFEYVRVSFNGLEPLQASSDAAPRPDAVEATPAGTQLQPPPSPSTLKPLLIEPEMPLKEVAVRVAKCIGGGSSEKIGREIGDKVVMRGIRVWARYNNRPIEEIEPPQLRRATFKPATNELMLPGLSEPIFLGDVRFSRDQVDQVWPPKTD